MVTAGCLSFHQANLKKVLCLVTNAVEGKGRYIFMTIYFKQSAPGHHILHVYLELGILSQAILFYVQFYLYSTGKNINKQ